MSRISLDKFLVLITFNIVYNKLCRPVFFGCFADFARAVSVRPLNTVFACKLTGENKIFGVLRNAAR